MPSWQAAKLHRRASEAGRGALHAYARELIQQICEIARRYGEAFFDLGIRHDFHAHGLVAHELARSSSRYHDRLIVRFFDSVRVIESRSLLGPRCHIESEQSDYAGRCFRHRQAAPSGAISSSENTGYSSASANHPREAWPR
jgi:hypothetical protein